jgi:hypothetical protein
MAERSVITCGHCKFWLEKQDPVGVCRRYPPTTVSASGHVAWPVTNHEDWCGEFVSAEPPPEKSHGKTHP